METHIGSELKKVMDEKRISAKQLSNELGVTVNSVYNMINRAYIHPEWLERISKFLDHDFFQYIYRLPTQIPKVDESDELMQLRNENSELKKELAYLKEINELLRKQKNK